MVLQIRPDAGQVVRDLDAVVAEVPGRADAGQLQDLGRADGAGREHDLAPGRDDPLRAVLAVGHGERTPAVQDDAAHQGIRLDPQVFPFFRRAQVRDG